MLKTRMLSLILLVQLLVTGLIVTNHVSAQNMPTLKVEPQSYTKSVSYINETFKINVTIANVNATSKLIEVEFRLRYNNTLLEVVNVAEGSFLTDPRWNLYGTFWVYYVEDDLLYGPHVLVGNMINANLTSGEFDQIQFPEGNGTIATITFKVIYLPTEPGTSASYSFEFIEDTTMLLDADGNEISHNTQNGYYEVTPSQFLAVNPSTYEASRIGETFNVTVDINNLDERWHLISAEFRLTYDPELLEVVNVAEGSFLTDPRWNLYGTFWVYYVEDDLLYGPHVLVGNMINANLTSGEFDQIQFPEGNGTIATITFKAINQTVEPEPPANCTLTLFETLFLAPDADGKEAVDVPHNIENGYYEIPPLQYPVAQFSYQPVLPSMGEVVIFNASESYDPDYEITAYSWNFGDGTNISVTEPVVGHVFSQQVTFNVTLTVTDIDGLSASKTETLSIGYYKELTINVDVGSIHFAGELAEFYILASDFGRSIDATSIKALLYYNGSLFTDLTNVTQHVDTGLYRIAYEIPAYTKSGTYTLVVEVECYSVKGTNLKSFLVSSTLSGFVTDITQGIATLSNGLTEVKMNLTAINAKLINIEGNIGIINSTVGTLKTSVENLNATITDLIANSEGEILANITTSLNTLTVKLDSIDGKIGEVNGDTVTIFTTLGEIETKLGDTQSTATTILYLTSTLSAIAVVLAAVILILLRKK